MPNQRQRSRWGMLAFGLALIGCQDVGRWFGRVDRSPPDSLPALLNDSLPFAYPVALYLQLIDDSVTLQLHIDEFGRPVPESTIVSVPATHAPFDTSALKGSRELIFRPAIRKGKPIPYTILFPIKFKIPTIPRLTTDTTARPAPDTAAR